MKQRGEKKGSNFFFPSLFVQFRPRSLRSGEKVNAFCSLCLWATPKWPPLNSSFDLVSFLFGKSHEHRGAMVGNNLYFYLQSEHSTSPKISSLSCLHAHNTLPWNLLALSNKNPLQIFNTLFLSRLGLDISTRPNK